MKEQRVYEALALGQTLDSILPALLVDLKAESLVLYFVGESEANAAFQHASLSSLREMKEKIAEKVFSTQQNSKGRPERSWIPFGEVWLCSEDLTPSVELALTEVQRRQLRNHVDQSVQLYLITFGNEVLGGLALSYSQDREPLLQEEKDLKDLLTALGCARRIEIARREREKALDRIERLSLVGKVLAQGLSLDRTLVRLLEIGVDLVEASAGLFIINSRPGESRVPPIGWGMPPDWADQLRFREGRLLIETILTDGKPLYLKNLELFERKTIPKFLKSLIAIPLSYEGGVLGCLCIPNPPQHFFEIEMERQALSALASLAGGVVRNARHLESEVKAARLQQEVKLAAQVQTSLIPQQLPQLESIEAAGVIRPFHDLGGDFYDIFDLGGGKWGIMIADVSGKGASAAILMATARAYLRAFAKEEASPGRVLSKMNQALASDLRDGRFLTAIYLILDTKMGSIQLAGAGHHPIFLLMPNGEVDCIPCDDFPLGILSGENFSEITRSIQPETTLLFYTDGLVEASTRDGRYFGSERMHAVLPTLFEATPPMLIQSLLSEVEAWIGTHSLLDDLTILAVRYKTK